MLLLIMTFAAVAATVLWYVRKDDSMRLGFLVLMYWGATLMWLVDAVFAYIEQGSAYFAPTLAEMLNDAFLGFSVVALGLVIWLVRLLVQDPKGSLRKALTRQ